MKDFLLNTTIEPNIDLQALAKRLHATPDTYTYVRAAELIEEAHPILQASYIIRRFPVGEKTSRGIMIAGQELRSRIVSSKLEGQPWAWIYIATAGREIADYMEQTKDPFDAYLLDEIASLVALYALEALTRDIEPELGITHHVKLSPGTIIDWSVEDVKKFFTLLDGDYQKLNVEVLPSGLINPLKSVSGLLYPTEEEFEGCDLCDRPDCPDRKTPFDEEKYNATINNLQ